MTQGWHKVKKGAWSGAGYWEESAVRADPTMIWADATGFADWARDGAAPERVPLLLELRGGKTAQAFALAMQANAAWIRVPELYSQPAAGLAQSTFCTAEVTKAFFSKLAQPLLQGWLERFEVSYPGPRAPLPAGQAGTRRAGPVVVGVLDDGLAFAHERFRAADGTTRVEYFWNQNGGETAGAQIDGWLAQTKRAGLADEDEIYRLAGYGDVARSEVHGTHVMDLACGAEPAVADGAPGIVCVQLPARPGRGNVPLGAHILDGLRYVLDRADRAQGAARPVVVNLSYANIAGPHDGSSTLERAIDELVQLRSPGLAVVLPTGNAHLSLCHAAVPLAAGAARELKWRLLPDCRTPSFLEIWLPAGTSANALEIEVTPSSGEPSGTIQAGDARAWHAGEARLAAAIFPNRNASGARPVALLAAAPTLSTERGLRGIAPAGIWTVRLRNTAAAPITVDAWIQRNDPTFGDLPYGRQARFDDPAYEVFDAAGREIVVDNASSVVRRAGTISGIAGGQGAIVLGAFRRSDARSCAYSGAEWPEGRAPDALAPGDDSPARPGVLGAGARSGSVFAMDGTSVAAPLAARWIAAELAAGRAGDRGAVSAQAQQHDGCLEVERPAKVAR